MYPSVQSRPDFIVSSSTGEKQLLVEIKRLLPSAIEDAPATWVKQARERWQLPTGYVLLVTPERMVLWPPQSSVAPSVSPSVSPSGAPSGRLSVSAYQGASVTKASAEVLANYLSIERYPLGALSEEELSLVVSSWLGSVIFKPETTLLELPAQAWLVQSGLYAAIYRGFIRRHATVG